MLRTKLGPVAAAALTVLLATATARAADDSDVPEVAAGAPIVNAAPDAAPATTQPGVTHEESFGTEFRQPIGRAADDHPPIEPRAVSGSSVPPDAPPPRPVVVHHDDDPGAAISNAADQTGRAIDHGTKDFRNGAENFFNDVGHFFSGDK